MPASKTKRYVACGVPVDAVTPAEGAGMIVKAAERRVPFEVHLCNAYTLSLVERDGELRSALLRSDLNLPDGAPVAWLGRRAGTAGPVRGPGLVLDVFAAGQVSGISHYLYGAAPGVAERMRVNLQSMFPDAAIAGVESPPYAPVRERDVDALAERIRISGASLVWVGIGTPRQDYLVQQLASAARIAVVPVGAAFDFISGEVRGAPAALHGTGLEWLYRLYREPRRLWRRYLFGNLRFARCVLRSRRWNDNGRRQ